MIVSDEEFACLNTLVEGKGVPNWKYAFMFSVDIVMYCLFIFNRGHWADEGIYMLIAHYYSWHAITDVAGYALPVKRRHWFNFFRCIAAFQMVQSVIWFWYADVEGWDREETGLRLGFSIFVFVQACLAWLLYGPYSIEEGLDLVRYVRAKWWRGDLLNKAGIMAVLLGIMTVFAGEFSYRTHKNYGTVAVDAQLISFQAGNGFTVLIKLFVLNSLINNPLVKVVTTFSIAAMFWIQWIWMIDMFITSPVPWVHIGGECVFTLDFVVAVRDYLYHRHSAKRPAVTDPEQQ